MRKHMQLQTLGAALILAVAACDTHAAKESTNAGAVGQDAVAASPPPVMAPTFVGATAERAAMADAPKATGAEPGAHTDLSFGSGALVSPADLSGAMLVRQGEASLEVRRIDDGVAKVRQAAAQFGGFVANTTLRNGRDEQKGATLEIRVPAAQFEPLLGALGSLGKVESVSASAQDVGEEYVDMGARAANARRVEARLVEMLASRTGKLSEVLTVEQELTRVREQIERYEARLRFLERRSAMSTLNLSLHEPLGLIDNPRPGPLAEALGIAWQRMIGVIAWCVASLGLIVPLAVLAAIGAVFVRRLRAPRPDAEAS